MSIVSIYCLNLVGYSSVLYFCVRVLLFFYYEFWENDGIFWYFFIIFRIISSLLFVNLIWFFFSNVKLYNEDDGMYCIMVGNIYIYVFKLFWCLFGIVIIKILIIICYCLYIFICYYNVLNFIYYFKLYRNDSLLILFENLDIM